MPISNILGECPKCGYDMDEYPDTGQWLCHKCEILWDVFGAPCPRCKTTGKVDDKDCRNCSGNGYIYDYHQNY